MLFYQPDSKSYERLALNLIAGHGFSQGQEESFAPDIYRTPVYPLFIALIYAIFGQAPQAVSALQVLIASLATGLCYLMGRQMLSEREARLGSVVDPQNWTTLKVQVQSVQEGGITNDKATSVYT